MRQKTTVKLINLLLSLSDALDLANPDLSQHQLKTAFIANEIGKRADLSPENRTLLFVSSLLHDIGALTPEEKLDVRHNIELDPEKHCILGEKLLKPVKMFKPAAKVIRYHHTNWSVVNDYVKPTTALLSQILMLADKIEGRIDRQVYILHQDSSIIEYVKSLSGDVINPDLVDLFLQFAHYEEFWLDLASSRLYSLLLNEGPGNDIEVDLSNLLEISRLFRDMIDFRSRFTSTHSSGVASTASTLARLFSYPEQEIILMKVAGNFHDLGKLVIPNNILTKPGKLLPEEFAIMRQHTYFTYSVLKTIGGINFIAEWAAFHHEHLDGSGYPFHVTGNEMTIKSRIMAVADIFTALAENRPYRKPMEKSEIFKILYSHVDKNWLDPNVVHVLEDNYEEVVKITRKKQHETNYYYETMFKI